MKKQYKQVMALLMILVMLTGTVSPFMKIEASAGAPYDGLGPVIITGRRDFQWPLNGYHNIQSCFYDQRNHRALDFYAPVGTPVYASYSGKVVRVVDGGTDYYGDGYGNYVVVEHDGYTLLNGNKVKLYSKYNHMNATAISNGASVTAGTTKLGYVGKSGYVTGPHLDFQIFYNSSNQNNSYTNIDNSLDPYSNQLLVLPSDLYVTDSDPSGCGDDYVRRVKAIYDAPQGYNLDLNGNIDGVSKGNIGDAGVADVCIFKDNSFSEVLEISRGVTDYYKPWPTGTAYIINNIRGFGYQYNGVHSGSASTSGTIGNSNITVTLSFSKIPESTTAAKTVTYNGHVYERYDYHLSWMEAKAFCENKGGYLVSITSAQEQDIIENLLSGCPFGNYFIGATDENSEGNWGWVNGDAFTYENWDKALPEPNGGTTENYACIIGIYNPPNKDIGEWVDCANTFEEGFYSSSKNCGFICEYDKTYTISYNANGGNSNTVPDDQIKQEGQSINLSETIPKRSGHSFAGWALTPNATAAAYQPGDTFSIDADTTLYAVWKNLWIVALNTNGGLQTPEFESLLVVDGNTAVIPNESPAYDGHRFLGWSLDMNATQADYQPGDSYTPNADVMFFAVWQKIYASDWSETRPVGAKDELIETKTQYRYSTKETTTDTVSSKEGWTLTGTQQTWSEYGDWSEWSTDPISANESREVRTETLYLYYYFYCPSCGRHEPFQGLSDCLKYTLSGSDYHGKWFPTPYSQSNYGCFDYTSAKRYTTSLGDGQMWIFTTDNINDTAPGTKNKDSSDPDTVVIKTGYKYRTRQQHTVYEFERWTDWSDWSDTPAEASSTRNVETRTLYRCVVGEGRIMTLPSALTRIESEAFQNVAADAVIIPAGVTSIADNAFNNVIIIGEPASAAETYAEDNGLVFVNISEDQ